MSTKLFGIVAATTLLMVCGCTKPSSVSGTVTADGEKVTEGLVLFQPESNSGKKPAAGEIQPDGTYEVRTAGNELLSAGNYKVLFTPPDTLEDETGQAIVVSEWNSWQAEDKLVQVSEGQNKIAIKLEKKPEPPAEEDPADQPAGEETTQPAEPEETEPAEME
ncbi:hypothetical protein AB1K70_11580 [Bremerella sp. JC770]|uniref:hypothetical protein n=1 Tax=Bremerella sp. JC770 TaxID=3232137 RepID=UPI003457E9E4